VRGVAFSPDGKTLATAGNDLRLWRWERGRLLWALETAAQTHYTVCFTAGGRYLATGNAVGQGLTLDLREVRRRLAGMGLDW
jgi:WD40 repeat protein